MDEELDPYDSEEYRKFVAECEKNCCCDAKYRPCDGALVGGICEFQTDADDEESL
jgi:hypothetical protein